MMISDLKNQMSKLSSENEELKKKEEEVRLKLEHDKYISETVHLHNSVTVYFI